MQTELVKLRIEKIKAEIQYLILLLKLLLYKFTKTKLERLLEKVDLLLEKLLRRLVLKLKLMTKDLLVLQQWTENRDKQLLIGLMGL